MPLFDFRKLSIFEPRSEAEGEDVGFRFADLGLGEVINRSFPVVADPRAMSMSLANSVLFAFCGQVCQYGIAISEAINFANKKIPR